MLVKTLRGVIGGCLGERGIAVVARLAPRIWVFFARMKIPNRDFTVPAPSFDLGIFLLCKIFANRVRCVNRR